jgi:hypothetical protein
MRKGFIWVLCFFFLLTTWPVAVGAESYQRRTVEFTVGSKVMTVTDGRTVIQKVKMDVTPQADQAVWVPLRFATEGLGYEVNWDGKTRVVMLRRKNQMPVWFKDKDPLENPLLRELGVPGNACYGYEQVAMMVKENVAVVNTKEHGIEGESVAVKIVPPGRILVSTASLGFVLGVRGWEDPATVPPEKKTAGLAIDLVSE